MSNPEQIRVVILVSGSGTNLQAIIDARNNAELDIDIVGVVSDRPAAFGLQRAADAGIHTETVDYKNFASREAFDTELTHVLAALKPDLVVLAGYMRILADATVNAYQGRMLNVHPSLLPAYPGLNTYTRAMAAGEKWHGTTVHFVIPELDAGPPILQYRVAIRPAETEAELRTRVQAGEYIIYPQAISWFAAGRIGLQDGLAVVDGKTLSAAVVMDETE
jgi:phosphoribosylglycinamide formyltransferase-1